MPDLSGPLTTGVDALVDLVNERGTLSFQDASVALKVPMATIEAWAGFLEEEGLLKVTYSFTKPFLVAMSGKAKPGGEPTEIKMRHVERARKGQAFAPEAEARRPSEELLQQARDALAKGDVATAKAIYERLQKEYKEFPQRVELDRKSLIKSLSSLQADYLQNMTGADLESQDIADSVRSNLSTVQVSVNRGDLTEALNAFARAQEAFNRLKPEAEEVRLGLTPLLSQAQQSLVEAELAHSGKDWESRLQRFKQLLDAFDAALRDKQFQKAFVLYDQIEVLKKQIPSVFEERKYEVESTVLPIYEKLINTYVELAKRELKQKLELLGALQQKIDAALKAEDHQQASQLYAMARRAYTAIPTEFFEDKVQAQKQLLGYAQRISQLEMKVAERDVRARLARIARMADEAASTLAGGDVQGANEKYNSALAEFSVLPRGFLELKAVAQKKIIDLYGLLLQQTNAVKPVHRDAPQLQAGL